MSSMRRVSNLERKKPYTRISIHVLACLIIITLLCALHPLTLVAGFTAATINPSGSTVGSDKIMGGGMTSQESSQIEIGPTYKPVAIILVDSTVAVVHKPIQLDGTHSYLQKNDAYLNDFESISVSDGFSESLHTNTPCSSNETNTTESEEHTQPTSVVSIFHWDFGDGSISQDSQFSHTYQKTGIYTVTLTVEDDHGNTDTANTTITVVPSQISGFFIENPGTGGTLHLRWNPLPSDEMVYYQIYRNDRTDPYTTLSPFFTDTGLTNGKTYRYRIAAVDYDGNHRFIGPKSVEISGTPLLFNTLPIPDSGGPYFGWKNKPIVFDASQSIDYDGEITDYLWDFGDGTTKTGMIVTHSFKLAGTYAVTLTITDDDGVTQSDTAIVTIAAQKQLPTVNASGPYEGYTNQTIQFNGTHSHSVTGELISYEWDFGDETTGIGKTPMHCYLQTGTYRVTLTVTDEFGEKNSDTTIIVIKQGNRPPQIPTVILQKKDNSGIYEIVVQSSDPDENPIQYTVEWGDQTQMESPWFPSGTQLRATHQWETPGTFEIRIQVQDDQDAVSSVVTRSVHIAAIESTSTFSVETTIESFVNSVTDILQIEQMGSTQLFYSLLAGLLILVEILGLLIVFRKIKHS